VNAAILGDIAIQSIVLILFAKLIVSAACIAVGIPGGLIAPTIVMGAMVGGVFAYGSEYVPGLSSANGLFVMLGMGAMMSAVLQAPLAGLMALVELTANPHLVLPAMLAVVSANIVAKEVFHQDSVFAMLMRDTGLDYRNDPLAQSLRASMQEARTALTDTTAEALYVRRQIAPLNYRTFGVLLRSDVESSYATRY
jgi:CIC family chloride channel protein